MRHKFYSAMKGIILIGMVLSLPACTLFGGGEEELSVEDRVQTQVAETLAVEQNVQTIVAETMAASTGLLDEVGEPAPETTEVPVPTATEDLPTPIPPTPTATLTPTPSVPMVSVSVNTNCRAGPGQVYDIIGALIVGEQAEVVGAAVGGGYWIIKHPDRSGECWLWANYATVTGGTEDLPMYTPPPTPTPMYNWTGTWTTSHGPSGLMHETFIITLNQTNANVSGSFTIGTDVITLSGMLSTDYMTLTGTWTQGAFSGPFVFRLINVNQFIGNRNNGDYEWCGHRAGAGLPSPCLGP